MQKTLFVMKNNYCVYIHLNKINNKAYIGLTGQAPEKKMAKWYSL